MWGGMMLGGGDYAAQMSWKCLSLANDEMTVMTRQYGK